MFRNWVNASFTASSWVRLSSWIKASTSSSCASPSLENKGNCKYSSSSSRACFHRLGRFSSCARSIIFSARARFPKVCIPNQLKAPVTKTRRTSPVRSSGFLEGVALAVSPVTDGAESWETVSTSMGFVEDSRGSVMINLWCVRTAVPFLRL